MLVSLRTKNLVYTDVTEEKEYLENEDESTDEPILLPFPEEHQAISKDKTPILFEMFTGKERVPTRILNALFLKVSQCAKEKRQLCGFYFWQ